MPSAFLRKVAFLLSTLAVGGCQETGAPSTQESQPSSGGAPGSPRSPEHAGSSAGGSVSLGGTPAPTTEPSAQGGVASCVTASADAEVERVPVDIIVVIDNSGSMQDEIDAVETNINVNFANILEAANVDYRLILLSQHEVQDRALSICVTTPLSANVACPPVPDQPAFTAHFYQYSTHVDSVDSLELLVDTFDDGAREEFGRAPDGWGAWLRPEATKVFLEITDDNSLIMTKDEFLTQLSSKTDVFGTAQEPRFRFHSIVGLSEKPTPTEPWFPGEPLQTDLCTSDVNGNGTVENAGPVYQELSLLTNGLRFPICQFAAFDAVFKAIADDVAHHATLSCSFPIPAPPPGRELDLAKVAVSYTADVGESAQLFGQVESEDECVAEAFYVDAALNQIVLCPETCAAAQTGASPKIEVVFACEDTFVKPPR
jgi:hypothetical protein